MIGGSATAVAATGVLELAPGDPPGAVVVAVTGLTAAGLVVALWSVVGHAITIAHEGGHALVAVLWGNSIDGVQLNRDRTGLTSHVGGRAFTITFVGYAAPSLFGLAGALVLTTGETETVLWISLVSLLTILVAVSNVFGWISVVVTGAVLVLTANSGSTGLQTLVACVWVWLLLFGGLWHVVEHFPGGGDHATLRSMTWVPGIVWATLHLAIAGAALLGGAALLFTAGS